MGMFDTIVCRYPLPHHQDAEFQTKDLAAIALGEHFVSGLLDEYKIAADVAGEEMAPEDDDRPEAHALLKRITAETGALGRLLRECSDHWGYEDPVYRLYHQSFKVYALQERTSRIVSALESLRPGHPLDEGFRRIVADGTDRSFVPEHNRRWLEETRPIVEAFFHARYFLEMAVRYGRRLDAPPRLLPSGWAALLGACRNERHFNMPWGAAPNV